MFLYIGEKRGTWRYVPQNFSPEKVLTEGEIRQYHRGFSETRLKHMQQVVPV
jgi:hypothetical protein